MKLTLLGTGSGDGWPNPFCECASCEWMREVGRARIATSALIDDVLLIDCGPAVPVNASRLGIRLRGVRYLLLSHSHPDHNAAAALLWRDFAHPSEPLIVAGPAAALAGWSDWVAPDAHVSFRPVTAGEELILGAYSVFAVPATHGGDGSGEALLYAVKGPDASLLYGSDTAALSDAALAMLAVRNFDVILLEETFGDLSGHATQHLDLTSFPDQLDRLRAVGAMSDATRVIAVHLSHRNPVEPELSSRFAAWGAEVLDDGAVITVPSPRSATRTLVTGGARSGKSAFAERLLESYVVVDYVATGPDGSADEDWAKRVALHRAQRPAGWITSETRDLVAMLAEPGPPILIDCLALWLAHQCDVAGIWQDSPASSRLLAAALDALVEAWQFTPRRAVMVTNEVGSGIHPETSVGRRYRDELGRLNARIAAVSEQTWLLTAGRAQLLP